MGAPRCRSRTVHARRVESPHGLVVTSHWSRGSPGAPPQSIRAVNSQIRRRNAPVDEGRIKTIESVDGSSTRRRCPEGRRDGVEVEQPGVGVSPIDPLLARPVGAACQRRDVREQAQSSALQLPTCGCCLLVSGLRVGRSDQRERAGHPRSYRPAEFGLCKT